VLYWAGPAGNAPGVRHVEAAPFVRTWECSLRNHVKAVAGSGHEMLFRRIALVALIVLSAFALRVHQLDTQSLWYDEGLSVYLAVLPPADTIAQSAVTDHPPLHALILGVWMRLAGPSEFPVRFVSVAFGTLAVALTYALGRRTGRHRTGVIAAALIAIAPIAVWYSQEARGYSLLMTLLLIAVLAFLRLLGGDSRLRVWLAYTLACAAALYTHYFAVFPIAALNVAFLLRVVYSVFRRAARNTQHAIGDTQYAIRNWFLAHLAIVLLFLPWLPNALAQAASNATYFPGRVTWQTVVIDTWRAFSGGEFVLTPPTDAFWFALILIGIFSITPILPYSRFRKHVLTLVCLLIIPLLLMSILAWDKPKFAPRYLLPSLPAFVTLAALGVDALLRFRIKLLAVVALAPMLMVPAVDALGLARIYSDPDVARPDMRAVVAYVDANDAPGDAILLVGGHQAPVFQYYYRGPGDVIPLPPDLLPAVQSPLDARIINRLADVARTHPRAWLVLWQNDIADPTGIVLSELLSKAARRPVLQNFHQASLLLFDLSGAQFATGPQAPLDVAFTDPIRLVGYNLASDTVSAGQTVKLDLYFESSGSIGRNYQVFVHLIGPDGAPIAQDDHIAGADSYPTSLWASGTLMRNSFVLRVPADTPPGSYRLIAGLYDAAGRLSVSGGGDSIDIAAITIRP